MEGEERGDPYLLVESPPFQNKIGQMKWWGLSGCLGQPSRRRGSLSDVFEGEKPWPAWFAPVAWRTLYLVYMSPRSFQKHHWAELSSSSPATALLSHIYLRASLRPNHRGFARSEEAWCLEFSKLEPQWLTSVYEIGGLEDSVMGSHSKGVNIRLRWWLIPLYFKLFLL